MRGIVRVAFYGLVRTPVVRQGADYKHRDGQHRRQPVYAEMLRQVARDYAGLPDVRTLKDGEIRFFYEGLRAELHEGTKPREK